MEQYNVTGMSCTACSARVEKAVKSVPGVTGCSVSLLTNSMGVEGTAEDAAIIRAVEQAGYGASPKKAAAAASTSAELDALADHETPKLKRRLIASLGFLLVLMYFSMGHMMWGWPLPHWFDGNHVAMGLVQLLLAGIVILLSILILLTLWSVLSQHIHQPAASAAESEPASSEVMVPQNLVPNFIGMDYTQVQNNREYTSMYLFYVTEEYSDTAPAGQIIQQEPSADTVLKAGETIQLVVSKGPQMAEMPNIIGFTQDSAVKELEARGLVASCFMVVNDGSYASGCVVRTSEEPGTKVEVGTVITVYIAADPSVQITATPEEPAATEPTTPETTPEGSTEPEYDTD